MDTNVIAVAGANALASKPAQAAIDASGAIAETQQRLESMCKAQGHLMATTITGTKGCREIVHACQRCGLTDVRTLTAVK